MTDTQGNDLQIQCREIDGFCNATLMCQSAGRKWDTYNRTQETKRFMSHLESVLQVNSDGSSGMCRPVIQTDHRLVISVSTGANADRGTWVHPKVAIHLAQWISPAFAVWVTDLVQRYVTGVVTSADSHTATTDLSSTAVAWTKTDSSALLSDHDRKPVVYIGETLPGLIINKK